ncbi:MAG: hypothetical protein HYW77_00830 [Parcubacteria group bacterium]|nr:hypothetical protein [Parcubacteria group bacterium]
MSTNDKIRVGFRNSNGDLIFRSKDQRGVEKGLDHIVGGPIDIPSVPISDKSERKVYRNVLGGSDKEQFSKFKGGNGDGGLKIPSKKIGDLYKIFDVVEL